VTTKPGTFSRDADEHDARNEQVSGLPGTHSRVYMPGGPVALEPVTGQGFSITVTFPLQAVERDEALP
jgi:two-component system sensor histidine kinase UhpB